jgi:beta-lactamase regulating signal transducer with metallopeptidase domain
MSWLHYLTEASVYLGAFYLCYCLFLNGDTHYLLGRVYLLFSCVAAYILPLTQLSVLKPAEPAIQQVQQVVFAPANVFKPNAVTVASSNSITLDTALIYSYIAGALVASLVLLFRLRKLYVVTQSNNSVTRDGYKLINLPNQNTAFSFFNYLFVGNNVPQPDTIMAHELVHIRQKHSADIIFLEVLKIINWYNPFVYLVQRSLKTLHEYIADEQTAAYEHDALTYSSFLLNNAYGIQGTSISHSFFNYNLLKKRIVMLNKNRSGKLARLKYLTVLPLCAGMLCASTLVFSKDYGLIELAPKKAVKQRPFTDSLNYTLQLTTQDGSKGTSDKIIVNNERSGFKRTYTVNSVTEKDKEELLERGLSIAIIKRENDLPDTTKKRQPPPPPLAPREPLKSKSLPPPVVAPGKPARVGKVPPPPPLDIRKPLKDKPLPPSHVAIPENPTSVGKIPPPPPLEIRDQPSARLNAMPPPAVPYEPIYDVLIKYIAKHTRYPTVAYDNKVNGHVLLSVTINSDHKISDAKVERGIGFGCDEEAVRAIKSYANAIDKAAGTYKMAVTFMLINEKNHKSYAPKALADEVVNARNFIGQVMLAGYL